MNISKKKNLKAFITLACKRLTNQESHRYSWSPECHKRTSLIVDPAFIIWKLRTSIHKNQITYLPVQVPSTSVNNFCFTMLSKFGPKYRGWRRISCSNDTCKSGYDKQGCPMHSVTGIFFCMSNYLHFDSKANAFIFGIFPFFSCWLW